ncbi:uroplakin-3b-like [Bufo gargarizans]|uniref:uroplakin-3b-like n=1 Tax=Bufo gargarizans TaxID=30331 RepID=UPI001CF2144C|nr:uroplakin-3b-like [Bufo gargarizans]
MDLLIKLGLLLMGVSATFAEVRFYIPQVTVKQVLGKLTNNSFALDEPQCIFQQYNTTDVWLVIALDKVVPSLTPTNLSNPSNYNLFQTNKYYHIYKRPATAYPCFDTVPKPNAMIPVGTQLDCQNVSFCNGILTENGPYRVKFVLLNNTTLIQETRWSEKISPLTGTNYNTIDTRIERHSAGMIIIIVILSVLLALLLALLIAALATGSKDICWCRTLDAEGILEEEEVDMNDFIAPYKKHNIYFTHSRNKIHQNQSTM